MKTVRLPSRLEVLPSGEFRRRYYIEATDEIVVYGHPVHRSPEYRLCYMRPGDRAAFEAVPEDPMLPNGPFKWVLRRKIPLSS